MTLTETQLKKLPPPEKDTLTGLGDSLFLRHRTTGRKTFIIRRKVAGRMTVTTVGDWPDWSIQRARAAALAPTKPLAERITFGEAAGRFCTEMIEARYRSKPEETCAFFVRDAASLYSTPLQKITRAQLIGLVTKKAATAPNSARKMLTVYKQWSKWAVLHDLLPADPLSVVTVGNLGIEQYKPRDRTLATEEIKRVLSAEGRFWPLMRFLLATGCRIGEALSFDDEQLDGDVWTIPITKNGKSHSLWLTAYANEQRASGWPRICYESVWKWANELDEPVDWNFHDLRRTAATLMREAGVSVEDVETVLNHSPGRLVQVYQRHDTMPAIRAALEKLEQALNSYKQ
jgi:integrase